MAKPYLDLRKGKTGRNFCGRWIYHTCSRALLEMPVLGAEQIQNNELRIIFHNKWKDRPICYHIHKHNNDNMINTAFNDSTSIKTNLLLTTPHFSVCSVIEGSILPIVWLLAWTMVQDPSAKDEFQNSGFSLF